jgi:hypothetical protein
VQFTPGRLTQMARPKGKKVAIRLSVGLSEPHYLALLALAEQNEATVAWLIRRAVAEFLARHGSLTASKLHLSRPTRKQSDARQPAKQTTKRG